MRIRFTATALLALVLFALPALAGDRATFPDLPLSGELSPKQLAYLGAEKTPLRLSDVDAEYLFVEVFSMYCPYCQRDAPGVNALFERARDMNLGSRLRFVGIGTGNTQYEVDFFADKFKTPFPLLPDEDYAMHRALGNVGTPYFLLLRNAGPGRLEILGAQEGSPENLNTMFDEMLKEAGLP